MKLIKVFVDHLDRRKEWYILTTEVCSSTKPNKFVKLDIFNVFKDDVCTCNVNDLRDKHGQSLAPKLFNLGVKVFASHVQVRTLFALFVGNLRKKNVRENDEFFKTAKFLAAKDLISRSSLDMDGIDTCSVSLSPSFVSVSHSTPVSGNVCSKNWTKKITHEVKYEIFSKLTLRQTLEVDRRLRQPALLLPSKVSMSMSTILSIKKES